MKTLWLDLETYNEADIKVGTYRYAETAEVTLFAYALDDDGPSVWDRASGETMPGALWNALQADDVTLVAHNANFDRTVIRLALDIDTELTRWRCTMCKAFSHAFPGSLEKLGAILGLGDDQAKLKDGKRLVQMFCKPAPKNHKADRYDHTNKPEEWARFKEYAAQDITAMREIDRRLPDWNWRADDIAMYHLDQRINDRGFVVDTDLVEAGAQAAVDEKARMAARFVELTHGVVEKPTRREQLRKFLNETFALSLEDTKADTFRDLLKTEDLHPDCVEIMQISIASNKTSTAKYAKLLPSISSDGRFRGGLQFRGAQRTRRWAGRGPQFQNLPSRGLPDDVDAYIDALKAGVHDLLFDDLMLYGSAALRGVLVAPAGKRLAIADLSNIEGRVLAYLAGERWKLQAFKDYDKGEGPDLYKITAASILGGAPDDVSKENRNVFGKVPDLAGGYAGGYGAYDTFCAAYGVAMLDYWDTIAKSVDPKLVSSAKANWTSWGEQRNPEADPEEWLAREVVKLAWRARHPKTVQLWKACSDAATRALQKPGTAYRAGPQLSFRVTTCAGYRYLLMKLPSRKVLCYFDPRLEETENSETITYMGLNSVTNQWERQHTHGGKLVENACQSLAMDIMAYPMPEIDKVTPIVLSVHDELIAEQIKGGEADLADMMMTVPEWLPDFPLAAAGFTADRYRKD